MGAPAIIPGSPEVMELAALAELLFRSPDLTDEHAAYVLDQRARSLGFSPDGAETPILGLAVVASRPLLPTDLEALFALARVKVRRATTH